MLLSRLSGHPSSTIAWTVFGAEPTPERLRSDACHRPLLAGQRPSVSTAFLSLDVGLLSQLERFVDLDVSAG